MATNTTNYNFKKPDESDFYSVQDQNNNWDKADAALKDLDTPTFEDYSGSTTVPDAATAIGNIKSKGKLSTTFSNIKAAFKGACLIGQIINNCVTNNAKLPLSAAQGKALMDLYTKLNSDLGGKIGLNKNAGMQNMSYVGVTIEAGRHAMHIYDANKAYISTIDEIGAIPVTMVSGVTAKSGYVAAYGRLCAINLVVTAIALQNGTYNLCKITLSPLSNAPIYIYDDVNQVACPGEITTDGYIKFATSVRAAGDVRIMGTFYTSK